LPPGGCRRREATFNPNNITTQHDCGISELGRCTMDYVKPEVKILGEATAVIEFEQKVTPIYIEVLHRTPNPAYDLDE